MFSLRINKSIIVYFSIAAFLVLIYSMVFLYLMSTYENKNFDFFTAVYWVIMTMTTTGFGEIYFISTIGRLYTIVVIISGVSMIFALLFPLVITPWLEETIRRELPSRIPVDIKDHIIICGYSQLVETLIEELKEYRIPFIVI